MLANKSNAEHDGGRATFSCDQRASGSSATKYATLKKDPSIAGKFEREESVLELYHNINSVCAQKVRIALMKEKGQRPRSTS